MASSAAMAPWRYLAAHHRHSVTSGAGTTEATGTAASSLAARPAAAFAAADSSAFIRGSFSRHHR